MTQASTSCTFTSYRLWAYCIEPVANLHYRVFKFLNSKTGLQITNINDSPLSLRRGGDQVSQALNIVLLLCTLRAHNASVSQKLLQLANPHAAKVCVGIQLDHFGALATPLEVLQETTQWSCLELPSILDRRACIPVAEDQQSGVAAAKTILCVRTSSTLQQAAPQREVHGFLRSTWRH